MVAILRESDGDLIGDRLLALSMPVVLLALLAIVAVSVAFAAHKRGLDETWRTLDAINRIRRENEVPCRHAA